MTYDKLEHDLATFDQSLSSLNLECPPNSSVGNQLQLIREFLADRRTLPEQSLLDKWDPHFKEFYDAQLVVGRLTDAVSILAGGHLQRLRSYLKTIFAGDLTQSNEPSQAKDFLYELWLASIFTELGFEVSLAEPDIIISGNGLTDALGIACKFPSSMQQVHPHLSKGYKQIRNQALRGVVAIGLDLLVSRTAFPNGIRFIDFRQGDKHPLDVAQRHANEATEELVSSRTVKYPSEDPADGLLMTLTIGGIFGDPASLLFVTAMTLQCDDSNPIQKDLMRIYEANQMFQRGPED